MEGSEIQGRLKELKAFDDTKAGVKGLVDSGIVKVPQIFVQPKAESDFITIEKNLPVLPVIDLDGLIGNGSSSSSDSNSNNNSNLRIRRAEIVEEVRVAAESWGFFQVLNHGIPEDVMNQMIEGVRKFHEQPKEVKMKIYSREKEKKVKFQSNFDLFKSKAANWRDTLVCVMGPNPPNPDEFPSIIKEEMLEYSKHMKKLGEIILELLSEALGLTPNYLRELDCGKGHSLICHYYPACPEPDRTLGHAKHRDPDFLTVLLQDQIGGLQVRHRNQWINVHPIKGALVINIGDLLQLISNDKFQSVEHRVLANHEGPRISVACLFATHFQETNRVYSPIQDLTSNRVRDLPLYKETSVKDYYEALYSIGLGGTSVLDHFKIIQS